MYHYIQDANFAYEFTTTHTQSAFTICSPICRFEYDCYLFYYFIFTLSRSYSFYWFVFLLHYFSRHSFRISFRFYSAHSHTHDVCPNAGIAFAPGYSWARLLCFQSHTLSTPAPCIALPTLLSLSQCSVAAMPCGVYFLFLLAYGEQVGCTNKHALLFTSLLSNVSASSHYFSIFVCVVFILFFSVPSGARNVNCIGICRVIGIKGCFCAQFECRGINRAQLYI